MQQSKRIAPDIVTASCSSRPQSVCVKVRNISNKLSDTDTQGVPVDPMSTAALRMREGTRGLDGLDVVCTKVAVDFQRLPGEGFENTLISGLAALLEAIGEECLCIGLLAEDGASIEQVLAARGTFSACRPQALEQLALSELPWINTRLAQGSGVEILDTDTPAPSRARDAQLLQGMQVGCALMAGFRIEGRTAGFVAILGNEPREGFDANLHLLLLLIATSVGSGLEGIKLRERLAHAQERHELVLQTAHDGFWDFDVRNGRMFFSPRWLQMLGYHEEPEGQVPEWRKLVHPEDMARVQIQIREHLEGETELFESVHRMRHANGDWRWMESRAKALQDGKGRLKRLLGVETDVTERKRYEEALFREKESAQITLQSIGDGVVTTDGDSRVQYLNPVAEDLTGWKVDDAVGRNIDDIFRGFHEETCEPLENPLALAIRRNRTVKSVRPTLLIRRDGNELYIESVASPIRDPVGNVSGGVLVFHDVSEARELNRRLSYHASHDMLTGLVNRREFEHRLERAVKSANARETSYVVCHLDLDQFRIVNDTCGHSAGDALLGQIGALLKSKIRWRDTLARLGGDEFGLLLESCSLEEAMRTAEILREAIAEFRFAWDERSFRLGASVGVVPILPHNEDVASILSAADSACQAAKDAGRNRVYSYEENDLDLMRRRREMQWAARINNALDDGRFELFRQTILPLQTRDEGAHYELLLRMRDENGAFVSPELFITAAERYGITPAIDRWVIEHAFRWLVSEADERERLSLCSINLSGQSLGDDKFLPFVIEQFHRSGLDARKICFEITETAAVANYSQANRFIQALKELGCMFALDDFGTGLSSFGYLKHFPVDFLKIDGSFVKEILHDPIDREMVRSINELGHLTGKKTIAEFAENQEIIAMLRGMGIDYAQGYGISEPKRVESFAVNL
jgi:diguanylate cyclase (GGDEF)-like protein/PAS domain S-box-containing protein